MLDSVPVLWQAFLWPLIGAVLVLGPRRFVPGWLRRLIAFAASVFSLSRLWALRNVAPERVEIFWEPLTFFRMGPAFSLSRTGLMIGLALAGFVALAVLGIRGSDVRQNAWHGLLLVALTGCLAMTAAANLVTLALGSALLDLALLAIAATAPEEAGRTTWRMVVPGAASTLLLFAAAARMDAQVGSASLMARDIPSQVLLLVGLAGVFRLLVFPLFPWGLTLPESLATLVLPVGVGTLLLARLQLNAQILADQGWVLALGGAALAFGGILAWAGHSYQGIAIHQTGSVLLFVLWQPATPWPLISLMLVVGLLAVWWDATRQVEEVPRQGWSDRLVEGLRGVRARAGSAIQERAPAVARWRDSWFGRRAVVLAPLLALASVGGAPLTIGAVARWALYAVLLGRQESTILVTLLVADTLLTAGLWHALGNHLDQAREQKIKAAAQLAMTLFSVSILILGIASRRWAAGLGLRPAAMPDVSIWGLGFVFVLPWLLGTWLARIRVHLEPYLELIGRLVSLDWLFQGAARVGQRLAAAGYWLSQVGEGEGWWGWALIILALGVLFFTSGQ